MAMMAEAEYDEFFREAFSALDEAGNGWGPASSISDLLRELNEESNLMSDINIANMMERFGMDEEGHIDYEVRGGGGEGERRTRPAPTAAHPPACAPNPQAFVNLMMSTGADVR